jgi:dTDP-4-dehydrorhamnose 3,5-epimerase
MGFRIESRNLGDIVVLVADTIEDERGFFMETFRADKFKALGLPHEFVQDNHSRSKQGVVRGLHFQWDPPMGKLMRVVVGGAFLVAVDVRKGSPTLGRWFGLEVSGENKKQVWAPAGFARGLCVLSEFAEVEYKCTSHYSSKGESGIRFDDPDVGIRWPDVGGYVLSERDRNAQRLAQWLSSPYSDYVRYQGEN